MDQLQIQVYVLTAGHNTGQFMPFPAPHKLTDGVIYVDTPLADPHVAFTAHKDSEGVDGTLAVQLLLQSIVP